MLLSEVQRESQSPFWSTWSRRSVAELERYTYSQLSVTYRTVRITLAVPLKAKLEERDIEPETLRFVGKCFNDCAI